MLSRRLLFVRGLMVCLLLPLTVPSAAAQTVDQLSDRVTAYVSVPEVVVAITGVRLVDGTGSPARSDQTILVQDGRIAAVGPDGSVDVPAGARVIDGMGHTVTPGWVMLHEHMFYPAGEGRYNTHQVSFPPLYLAGGATTIRTGGSLETYTDLRIKREIVAGNLLGPRMDVTAPYLEGPGGFAYAFPVLATPQETVAHVNFWADQGTTSYKAYNVIDRVSLRAGIEAAHARGFKVTGHLCSITYREAVEMGIDNLEHGFFAATDWVQDKEPDVCPRGATQSYLDLDLASPAFTDLVDLMVERGVALTSTLNVVERRVAGRPPLHPWAFEAMADPIAERVEGYVARERDPDSPMQAYLRKLMDMEMAYYEAGGFLVAGTDPTGSGDVVPGFANLRSLELLMEVGLTLEQAVEVATLNGAKYLDREADLGSVEVGKLADLIFMRGDPARNGFPPESIVTVFKDGVGYDAQKIFGWAKGRVGIR